MSTSKDLSLKFNEPVLFYTKKGEIWYIHHIRIDYLNHISHKNRSRKLKLSSSVKLCCTWGSCQKHSWGNLCTLHGLWSPHMIAGLTVCLSHPKSITANLNTILLQNYDRNLSHKTEQWLKDF